MPQGVNSRAVGRDNFATGQVSVAATAGGTLIVGARPGRDSVTIVNHGTTDVYVGVSGLTTSNGVLLEGAKGAAVTLSIAGADIYGIVGTGTQTVSYVETY